MRENPSQLSREGATRDPVDNARVSCLDLHLVLRTVRAAVRPLTLCLLWPRALPLPQEPPGSILTKITPRAHAPG